MGVPMRFEFATATRIVFGTGVADRIGREASGMGRRAFVVTGAAPRHSQTLLRRLDNHHVMHRSFSVAAEPTTDLALKAAAQARDAGCDLVIGIGGGSVLDTGKVIAALLTNGGDLTDYLEVVGGGHPLTRPSAPFIAVPTTAGTGAEVTRNAVLESPSHRVKVSMRSPFMLPRLALVDPELTYCLPPALSATTGLDALAQLLEAFVSPNANPLTDGICREGLRRAARSLPAVVADGGNRKAREDMCVASLFSGLALANSKLGAVHGIAGPFGGMFKAPHGAVCGRLLAPVTAVNIAALREREPDSLAIARYTEAAGVLTGNPCATAEDGIAWLTALGTAFAIPPLSAYGCSAAQAEGLAAQAPEVEQHARQPRGAHPRGACGNPQKGDVTTMRRFSISASYRQRYPALGFGLAWVRGCLNPQNPPGFDAFKRKLLRQMRRRETLAGITARIDTYRLFFEGFGHPCPLPQHLNRTVNSGFPRYSLILDAHFLAEMCAGILVAAADADRFHGDLTLDVAAEGETCRGLGDRLFHTQPGEIVLRDERDIVCVLCQGADEKTRVRETTRNVLFYAYAVPGIERRHLKEGLAVAAEAATAFGGGSLEELTTH